MALAASNFFLRPNETVQAEAGVRSVWILRSALIGLLWLAILVGATAFVAAAIEEVPAWLVWWALGLGGFLLVVGLLRAWRIVATTEYVVTDETVYHRRGRFLLRVRSAPMDKITDITVQTPLLGRILGYSNLIVRTAGGAPEFYGLRDAYELRSVVQDQRKAFVKRLLAEAGRSEDATRSEGDTSGRPAPAAMDRCRCPSCSHAFDAPTQRPVDVTCPKCGAEGTLFEQRPGHSAAEVTA